MDNDVILIVDKTEYIVAGNRFATVCDDIILLDIVVFGERDDLLVVDLGDGCFCFLLFNFFPILIRFVAEGESDVFFPVLPRRFFF